VLEGRLRMNTVTRQDGVKEKKAEFTLSRLHSLGASSSGIGGQASTAPLPQSARGAAPAPRRVGAGQGTAQGAGAAQMAQAPAPQEPPAWNTSPLVPDLADSDDDIPF
jgi:single-stranded DNA-binding protein